MLPYISTVVPLCCINSNTKQVSNVEPNLQFENSLATVLIKKQFKQFLHHFWLFHSDVI